MNKIKIMKSLFIVAFMLLFVTSCNQKHTSYKQNDSNLIVKQNWPWPDSLDALVAAHETHKLLFENDSVRVLEVTIPPHTKEAVHTHRWNSILYVDSGGDFRDFDMNGNVMLDSRNLPPNSLKLPNVSWNNTRAPHAVENLSDVPIHLIRVEIKK